MTNFRVITRDTTYLNDGGPLADFGKKVNTEHWTGGKAPGNEVLGSIASALMVEHNPVLRGSIVPGPDMRRTYPDSQFISEALGRSIIVQKQRIPKILGWATVRVVAAEDLVKYQES